MKSYRRKFAKRALREATKEKVESRDGILWYIDSDSLCRVLIQGSGKFVTCHYPRNLRDKPKWLRVGSAVRIGHRSGVRGYIEVLGEGRAIPQPTQGSAMPPSGTTSDGVITGMIVSETSPPSGNVLVSDGTYRINGIVYSYYSEQIAGYIVMDDPAPMTMGVVPAAIMGTSAYEVENVESPSDGYFRYDAVVVGSDRVIDYIEGIEATSNPPYPAIPSDHILLSYILRVGGLEVIENQYIDIPWTAPKATFVEIEVAETFSWSTYDDTPEINVVATIYDQYNRTFRTPSTGWDVQLHLVIGTGNVYSYNSGYDSEIVTQPLLNSYSYTFKYERNQLAAEIKPFFRVEVKSPDELHAFSDWTELLNEGGDIIG